MDAKLLRYADVAERYSVPRGTLRWWVHKRLVPHIRVSVRGVFFDPDVLDLWFAQNVVPQERKRVVTSAQDDSDFNEPALGEHGTIRRYTYWGCRCTLCQRAGQLQNARRKRSTSNE